MKFSTFELESIQALQEAYMFDTGYITTISGYVDSYGDYVMSGVDNAAISCGLKTDMVTEKYGQVIVTDADAIVRLPIDTTINPKDKFTVTKRFDQVITPETYEVIGVPMRGVSGLQVKLKRYLNG